MAKSNTFLRVIRFGPSGSNAMTKCLIMNNGTNLRLNTGFGMNLLSTPFEAT